MVGMHCIGWSITNFCACKGLSIHSGSLFQKPNWLLKGQFDSRRDASEVVVAKLFSRGDFSGTMQLLVDVEPYKVARSEITLGLSTDHSSNNMPPQEIVQDDQFHSSNMNSGDTIDNYSPPSEDVQMISNKEIERRLKIGKANKGKTPWNKGIKHSEETRERIRKRTREALSDPKIKKKMSNSRAHSIQSKAKISSALTKIWKERLKSKRSQEKWFLLWRRTIAQAAKVGSHDQQELEWDAYEKMKAEFISQHQKLRAEKARAKEIARLRAERVAREKVAKLAQQNKEKEPKAGIKKPRSRNNPEMARKKNNVPEGFKLSRRLAKFHNIKKQLGALKSLQVEKIPKTEPCLGTWDPELIKIEIERRKVPLAEQIQSVKDIKANCAAWQVQPNGISQVSLGGQVRDN